MTTTYDAITGRAASFQDAVRKHARYSLARAMGRPEQTRSVLNNRARGSRFFDRWNDG
ncbi:MAG TPA: hypothetical protein VN687_00110 [Blastocatellia bacterium]|nr:hypothetical protein [Blastocatellia bacterium]